MIKQKYLFDIFIVLFTILIVIRTIIYRIGRFIWKNIIKSKIFGMYKEKRTLDRVRQRRARVYIGSKIDDREIFKGEAKLVDMNEEAFLIYTDQKIDQNDFLYKMEINYETYRGKRRKRSAICTGRVYRESEIKHDKFKYSYVIQYTPISPFNHYMIHQYFLLESMT